ncbi:MAG: DUF3006 domain-containing protein [Clostridia bacterium]|nr:DUF3006 domain-containing protein [Clostridia bacterium]
MKKKLQVDRFEGALAVLFDMEKNIYHVSKDLFGFELHEGDYLETVFENGKPVSAVFLEKETERERQKIMELMAKLRRKKN